MTPPLSDNRGFIPGRVNIIDGLAVQLATAAPASAGEWVAATLAADLGGLWALSHADDFDHSDPH